MHKWLYTALSLYIDIHVEREVFLYLSVLYLPAHPFVIISYGGLQTQGTDRWGSRLGKDSTGYRCCDEYGSAVDFLSIMAGGSLLVDSHIKGEHPRYGL